MKIRITLSLFKSLFYAIIVLTFFFNINTKVVGQPRSEESLSRELECDTELRIEQIDYNNQTWQFKESLRGQITDELNFIPLAIHIVRTSYRQGGLTEEELEASINELNQKFSQVNFTFEVCHINYIDEDQFFFPDMWSTYESTSLEYQMARPNLVEGALNIFFKPNINPVRCGWASFPGFLDLEAPKDWIVVSNNCGLGILPHEVGHYFNLYHPHQGSWTLDGEDIIVAEELVSRDNGNCGQLMVGDELCDTAAEPYRNNSGLFQCVDESCVFDQACNELDGMGIGYDPDTNNIMSYTDKTCRDIFTDGQKERMQLSLMYDRNYLLENCGEIGNLSVCSESDRLALIELYNATSGSNWSNPWNLNASMEQWAGVTLNESGCVENLNLRARGLSGELPIEIGNLADLTYLNLSNNSITGHIPKEIGYLHNIAYLNLSRNNFTGAIPTSIQYIENLSTVLLNNNALTGDVPEEFLRTNVTTPRLYNNQLSGCYKPNLIQLCSMQNPVTLADAISRGNNFDFTFEEFCNSNSGMCTDGSRMTDSLSLIAIYNALNGPEWKDIDWPISGPMDHWYGVILNNLGRVTQLSIGYEAEIEGSIPQEIGNLAYLQFLQLSNNNIEAPFPSEIENLSNLTTLIIENFNLSGNSFPESICNLSNLVELNIRNSGLEGEIPSCIGNLSQLQKLTIRGNGFEGSLPPELAGLNNLNFVEVCQSTLGGCFDAAFISWCDWALEQPNCISFNENWNTANFDATFEDFCNLGLGTCDESCPTNLNDSGIINQGIYSVSNSVISTGIIGQNQNVVYDAGAFVELQPGFLSDSNDGVVFFAKIEGCTQQFRERKLVLPSFFKIYPNPFSQQSTLEFELSNDTEVSIFISDITGKKLSTLADNQQKNAGKHQVTFNANGIAPGIYYCTLIAGDKIETQKMVITK